TFTAPSSGASLAIANVTITANENGVASLTASANAVAGAYPVVVSSGLAPSASFQLTNTPDAPAAIAATGGTPQTAEVGTVFSMQLQATVIDQFGNPTPGVTVTFKTDATLNAGATFPGGS